MNSFPFIVSLESAVELPRFQTKSGERSIELRRIVYLSAQLNYTVFHLETGEQVVTSLSLSTYAELLENRGFMRLHKSYLLNLHYLTGCTIQRFKSLTLPTGKIIEIARRRRAILKKVLLAYHSNVIISRTS